MKLQELEEMIAYCQEKRNLSTCPLITYPSSKFRKACIVKKECDKLEDCRIFYWDAIFNMVEDEIHSILSGFTTKEQALKKYRVLSGLCSKSHDDTHGHEYCGENCKEALYSCQKYLHHNISGMNTVYVHMEKVYPIIEWMLNNIDEIKEVRK